MVWPLTATRIPFCHLVVWFTINLSNKRQFTSIASATPQIFLSASWQFDSPSTSIGKLPLCQVTTALGSARRYGLCFGSIERRLLRRPVTTSLQANLVGECIYWSHWTSSRAPPIWSMAAVNAGRRQRSKIWHQMKNYKWRRICPHNFPCKFLF